jgi:glucoamylase
MVLIISKSVVAVAALSALSTARASPASLPRASDLDTFVAAERPIALQGALNNIGPNGSLAEGTSAGLVVASPSKANPNCEAHYHLASVRAKTDSLQTSILGQETRP